MMNKQKQGKEKRNKDDNYNKLQAIKLLKCIYRLSLGNKFRVAVVNLAFVYEAYDYESYVRLESCQHDADNEISSSYLYGKI